MRTKTLSVRWLPLLLLLFLLAGCSSVRVRTSPPPPIERSARWAVVPLSNHTTTPFAGYRAQKLCLALLQAQGVDQLIVPPEPADVLPLGTRPLEKDLHWARRHQVRYLVTGAVAEWRYKVGIDGEPAVALTLQLHDLDSDRIIWQGSASASGRYWHSVGLLGQTLLQRLVRDMLGG